MPNEPDTQISAENSDSNSHNIGLSRALIFNEIGNNNRQVSKKKMHTVSVTDYDTSHTSQVLMIL